MLLSYKYLTMQNYIYDANFCGNVLIIGRTGREKAYFTHFGWLKKVEWVSYIELKRKREAEIVPCFPCDVKFHYPFEDLLEVSKVRSRTAK